MVSWKAISELFRAQRAGASLGDLAVMKFVMLAGPSADHDGRLRSRGLGALDIDITALRTLPDGTVGREYARFLDRRGLSPLAVSPAMKERFAEDPYALRYTTTHDLLHLLTGFSTTPAGEMGLFAFMIAQGFAGGSRRRLWASAVSYVFFMPLHMPGILHNARLGLAMGEKAKRLIEEPLETYLTEPLDVVRRRLDLSDPATAGIAPGHDSLLARWLFPDQAPKPAASLA